MRFWSKIFLSYCKCSHLLRHAEYKHTAASAFIAKKSVWLRDVVGYGSNSGVNKCSISVLFFLINLESLCPVMWKTRIHSLWTVAGVGYWVSYNCIELQNYFVVQKNDS